MTRVDPRPLFSSNSDEWATPPGIFEMWHARYAFTVDAAATDDNSKLPRSFRDGLAVRWTGERVWCNPPYSEASKWVKKAFEETRFHGCPVAVLLLPARVDSKWFHAYVWGHDSITVEFIKGRLKFGQAANNAPFPSMVVVFAKEDKIKVDFLLKQNSEMRRAGIFNWSIPAYEAEVNGKVVKTCPSAGVCATVCYARNGSYNFRATRAAHARNLQMVLDDLPAWQTRMVAELQESRRYRGGKYVRIHDAGDFFSDTYTQSWMDIAAAVPDVTFYCYTKEVTRFRRIVEGHAAENFKWLFSLGGLQDKLVDRELDRHAEVFPSKAALEAAGYFDQEENDILAVTAPTNKIGIVANKIPHFRKKQGASTFGQWQQGGALETQLALIS